MNASSFFRSLLLRLSVAVFIVLIPVPSSYADEEEYRNCNSTTRCGFLQNISYPFWGGDRPSYCGHPSFYLHCPPDGVGHPMIKIGSTEYLVYGIESRNIMKVGLNLLDVCANPPPSTTLDFNHFNYVESSDRNLTLFFNCKDPASDWGGFKYECPGENDVYYADDRSLEGKLKEGQPECTVEAKVSVIQNAFDRLLLEQMNLLEAVNEGFLVQYQQPYERECHSCWNAGGLCGSDPKTNGSSCITRDGPPLTVKQGPNKKNKAIIGISTGVGGMAIASIVFLIYHCRSKKKQSSLVISKEISSDFSRSDVEKGSYLGLYVFSYEELEKATNKFDESKELGEGGFGTVYYGKLGDGRPVAVKRMYENNCKRVEQFMNEIEILARLRHQNLVTLYGYTSRSSRELLLVYEYVPNGTVADHLHGPRTKPGALPWTTRLKIAVETASALAYLHASDIIHRDVKTNNILLDDNYCVKVADFGLSRLFPTDVTHVSTAPQGTPGYVDPEYHQCYQLTSKSDVYSFGVVLIELISSKPAVDITRHRHEINLANMAITKISSRALDELVDPNLGYGSDQRVTMMINAVAELAFQCLQGCKDLRPSMAEILAVLQGIESEKHNAEKAKKADVRADDVRLLKSTPPAESPISVMATWISNSASSHSSS